MKCESAQEEGAIFQYLTSVKVVTRGRRPATRARRSRQTDLRAGESPSQTRVDGALSACVLAGLIETKSPTISGLGRPDRQHDRTPITPTRTDRKRNTDHDLTIEGRNPARLVRGPRGPDQHGRTKRRIQPADPQIEGRRHG